MEEGHLDRLAQLEALCFSQPWSRQALAEELGNPCACFFTALAQGQVAGYAGAHFAGGEFYMDNLAVFPDYRRQGVGRALVQALVGFAKENGGEFLTLEVRPSNAYALALYGGLGFRAVGRRRGFYTRPVEDALLLRLDFV